MSQTKLQSLKETCAQTGTGMAIAWCIVVTCIKYIPDPYVAATTSTLLCTAASLIRGYLVRRYFNRKS